MIKYKTGEHYYLGLDTETIKGFCRLIGLSDGRSFQINNLDEVILFFKGFSKSRKTYFICWNADYDIQALLKYFPKKVLNLLLRGLEIIYENDGFSFSFQYVPGKFLQFDGNFLFDGFQYYGTKLEVAARKYLGEGKLGVDASKITEGNIYSDEVIKYCCNDALLALKLFLKFRASLPGVIKEVKPISNAFYSYAYFRNELVHNRPNWEFNNYFRNAYHGGRFEIYTRGHFKNLYVYDINSAYPFEISNLRGLERACYSTAPVYMPDSNYSIYLVRVDIKDTQISPLIYKDKGLCVYPVGHYEGYITKGEFERIRKFSPEIVEAVHVYANDQYPFREKVRELYDKKKNSEFSLPFKTILNSLYGKTAQAVQKFVEINDLGKTEVSIVDYINIDGKVYVKFEDFVKSNFLYASEITARTRLRLYDIVEKNSSNVLMVQTDSIISRGLIDDLPLSDKLGDWKLEKWNEAYLIGSGVYFYRKGTDWFGKFRGFNLGGEKAVAILERILTTKGSIVEFQSLKRFSLQEAKRIHDEDLGNQILEVSRKLNLNFDRKRVWMGKWKNGKDVQMRKLKSMAIYSRGLDKA